MIAIIARMKMQAGKEDEALDVVRTMADAVEANEPKALAYVCHRNQKDPAEIIFFEVYADDEAFATHNQTPHMGVMRSKFAELFDTSTFGIERLERVGGFLRG
jgi:quinol monooxygenase YgiN